MGVRTPRGWRQWRRPLLITALGWLAFWTGTAWAGVADEVGATFGLILQDVVSAFPAVEGLVVAVDGEQLYMDLTEKDGVQSGQEYTIFRKGDVFRHPTTGRVMGRYEEVIGYAQVKRVLPQFSEAVYVPIPEKPRARPEDGVRITRGRIRVAVAPPIDLTKTNADLRRVSYMMAHALAETKRFQGPDPSAVQDQLAAQKTRSEELLVLPDKAVGTARTLEVTGWLVPVLIERRGVTYLDVTWVSGITGRALFSRRAALIRAETVSEQRFPWEPVPQD
ncbi:MAG TPA: hypothetical protein VMS64_30440 [Candidatus Methylomirabilis sp.]|nr:hypothetical protein [Candidatus Methylomirabilis sp.]